MNEKYKKNIEDGHTALGIEIGSSRIKSVLINKDNVILAQGNYTWENRLIEGVWTYPLSEIWTGIQNCYVDLTSNVKSLYNTELKTFGAIGVSAMMHGYLVFDKNDDILTPYRTWRNTMTADATEVLIREFNFNIPQRWSIAHLYHSILNKEDHVSEINYLTSLAGYVHWQLTGKKVTGINDASGIFPIDFNTLLYDMKMIEKFEALVEGEKYSWNLTDILPKILIAGKSAGYLTHAGVKLIDPSGTLKPGIPLAPPEGDGGTGMIATNSIIPRTGNISGGTSIFGMVVLEAPLKTVHEEIEIFSTPDGLPVAMVHCNNGTSDLDHWVQVFAQLLERFDVDIPIERLYDELYFLALEGDKDCGGVMVHNYISGEHITKFSEGRPLVVRASNAQFNLSNFLRAMINSIMATLRIGMDILTEEESVHIDNMFGHGGFFKTINVGQSLMANALKTPISVMKSAGEGGAWGMALLALYLVDGADLSLKEFLEKRVFNKQKSIRIEPNIEDMQGFDKFFEKYKSSLAIQEMAIQSI